jgi:hypothetical protein
MRRISSTTLVRRFAQVGQTVGVAGRQRQDHQVRTAFNGPLGTFQIGHQHAGLQPGQRQRVGQHLGGVGQLGQQAGGHKRAHLDLTLPGSVCGTYPFALSRCGQNGLDALQAIAKAHFTDDGLRG